MSKVRKKTVNGKTYQYEMSDAAIEKETEAKKRWQAENYDQLKIALPKGMRDQLHTLADSRGISVRALIIELIQKELNAAP